MSYQHTNWVLTGIRKFLSSECVVKTKYKINCKRHVDLDMLSTMIEKYNADKYNPDQSKSMQYKEFIHFLVKHT